MVIFVIYLCFFGVALKDGGPSQRHARLQGLAEYPVGAGALGRGRKALASVSGTGVVCRVTHSWHDARLAHDAMLCRLPLTIL